MKKILLAILFLPIFCQAQENEYAVPFGGIYSFFDNFNPTISTAAGVAYSNLNLTCTSTGSIKCVIIGGIPITTGMVYIELLCNSGTHISVGVVNASVDITGTKSLGADPNAWAYVTDNVAGTYKAHNNVFTSYGSQIRATHTVQIALDAINGFVYFGVDGTINGVPTSGASGTGAAFGGLTGTLYIAVGEYNGNSFGWTMNSNPTTWLYSAPAGYSAIHR